MNKKDLEVFSALQSAIWEKQPHVIKILCDHLSDETMIKTLIYDAIRHKRPNGAKYLWERFNVCPCKPELDNLLILGTRWGSSAKLLKLILSMEPSKEGAEKALYENYAQHTKRGRELLREYINA